MNFFCWLLLAVAVRHAAASFECSAIKGIDACVEYPKCHWCSAKILVNAHFPKLKTFPQDGIEVDVGCFPKDKACQVKLGQSILFDPIPRLVFQEKLKSLLRGDFDFDLNLGSSFISEVPSQFGQTVPRNPVPESVWMYPTEKECLAQVENDKKQNKFPSVSWCEIKYGTTTTLLGWCIPSALSYVCHIPRLSSVSDHESRRFYHSDFGKFLMSNVHATLNPTLDDLQLGMECHDRRTCESCNYESTCEWCSVSDGIRYTGQCMPADSDECATFDFGMWNKLRETVHLAKDIKTFGLKQEVQQCDNSLTLPFLWEYNNSTTCLMAEDRHTGWCHLEIGATDEGAPPIIAAGGCLPFDLGFLCSDVLKAFTPLISSAKFHSRSYWGWQLGVRRDQVRRDQVTSLGKKVRSASLGKKVRSASLGFSRRSSDVRKRRGSASF